MRRFAWLDEAGWTARLTLIGAGFLPVTLVAASTFKLVGLRDLATHVLVPVIAIVAVLAIRHRSVARMIAQAVSAGVVATAFYDTIRFAFIAAHLEHDPIPHIGAALHLHPAWVFGYLWRYLGNGTGLALAFIALGLKGVRAGIAFGLFVCAGLITLLIVSPTAQQFLFPLTISTVVMATAGHMVYGATVGAITARRAQPAPTPIAAEPVPDRTSCAKNKIAA